MTKENQEFENEMCQYLLSKVMNIPYLYRTSMVSYRRYGFDGYINKSLNYHTSTRDIDRYVDDTKNESVIWLKTYTCVSNDINEDKWFVSLNRFHPRNKSTDTIDMYSIDKNGYLKTEKLGIKVRD